MNSTWPEDIQERIELIIGAKYDEITHLDFLVHDYSTINEASNSIKRIQLIQRQLRQVKEELGNKIREIKFQQSSRSRRKDVSSLEFASLISDMRPSDRITGYQNIIFYINKLLNTCDKQKNEILVWIEQQKLNISEEINLNIRKPISDDVKIFVWNRDGGKCVTCGSQENLEFDHIIPLSKGGSSTARNLQLLCESCNREKGNKIGE